MVVALFLSTSPRRDDDVDDDALPIAEVVACDVFFSGLVGVADPSSDDTGIGLISAFNRSRITPTDTSSTIGNAGE